MKTLEKPPLENPQNEVTTLQAMLVERDEKIAYLEEQISWFTRQIFGKKSEKTVSDINQMKMEFEGFSSQEQGKGSSPEEVEPSPKKPSRRKAKRNGKDAIKLPANSNNCS